MTDKSIGRNSVPRTTTTGHIIPESLRDQEIWICFRIEIPSDGGKPKKVPKAPSFHRGTGALFNVSPTSTEHATTYDTAARFHKESTRRLGTDGADGLGVILTTEGDMVGVDLDDCVNPETGTAEDWAQEIVTRLNSYTEVSPSGTGLRILLRGNLDPAYGNRKGSIEIYERARYMTVTGNHVPGTPLDLQPRPREIIAIQREYLERTSSADKPMEVGTPGEIKLPSQSGSITDHGRRSASTVGKLDRLVKIACSKDPEFDALWHGNISRYSGDHSRADQALANKLSYWCKGNIAEMDRLFRKSALLRDKWDEPRGNSTYGQRTLETAIEQNRENREFRV